MPSCITPEALLKTRKAFLTTRKSLLNSEIPDMEKSRKKSTVILGIVLLVAVFYLGYRVVESRQHMSSLTEKATENDVRTVAIVHAEHLPAQETIQLPGTIEAWCQAPIYAQVSGYVKIWHKD